MENLLGNSDTAETYGKWLDEGAHEVKRGAARVVKPEANEEGRRR